MSKIENYVQLQVIMDQIARQKYNIRADFWDSYVYTDFRLGGHDPVCNNFKQRKVKPLEKGEYL